MVTTAARTATPGPSAAGLAAGRLIPQARPPGPDMVRAGPGDRAAATLAWDTGGTGSGTAEEATEPLAAVGDPGRELPGQIARFGKLAGRDVSARAIAALRARGAYDPQRHGDARDYRPLSAGEQLEMLALRAALTHDYRPGAPAGMADAGRSRPPERLLRPVRLRRPSSPPGLRRAAARHRRVADTNPGSGGVGPACDP
jgi:hypothetical protein